MPGTYSIISRASGSLLTAAIYMEDHTVHLTYNTPGGVDDYSTNVAQMQSTVDPGEVGTESLPTDLAGEIQRLRQLIVEITGKTRWYESPGTNLATVALQLLADNLFRIVGSGDATKKLAFEVDGITTGTTRTITPPNANLTLPTVAAQGDLPVGLSAGVLTVLTKGTARQVLAMNAGATTPAWADKITLNTSVLTTSGVVVDFDLLPAGVKRITVMGWDVSTNGTSPMRILCKVGPPVVASYSGGVSTIAASNLFSGSDGFDLNTASVAAAQYMFTITLTLQEAATNTWMAQGMMVRIDSTGTTFFTNGAVSMGGSITGVQLTTVNGTDTFDLGRLSISYE